MENSNKIQFNDQSLELFRSAAGWMRGFAIVMIIFVSIIALLSIFLIADKGGSVIRAFPAGDQNLVGFIKETVGFIIIVLVAFVLIYGYAASKLLVAANAFTAISYSPDRDQIIKAFKNLRFYWQFYGITLIVLTVFFIYFIIKMIMFISEHQP